MKNATNTTQCLAVPGFVVSTGRHSSSVAASMLRTRIWPTTPKTAEVKPFIGYAHRPPEGSI